MAKLKVSKSPIHTWYEKNRSGKKPPTPVFKDLDDVTQYASDIIKFISEDVEPLTIENLILDIVQDKLEEIAMSAMGLQYDHYGKVQIKSGTMAQRIFTEQAINRLEGLVSNAIASVKIDSNKHSKAIAKAFDEQITEHLDRIVEWHVNRDIIPAMEKRMNDLLNKNLKVGRLKFTEEDAKHVMEPSTKVKVKRKRKKKAVEEIAPTPPEGFIIGGPTT